MNLRIALFGLLREAYSTIIIDPLFEVCSGILMALLLCWRLGLHRSANFLRIIREIHQILLYHLFYHTLLDSRPHLAQSNTHLHPTISYYPTDHTSHKYPTITLLSYHAYPSTSYYLENQSQSPILTRYIFYAYQSQDQSPPNYSNYRTKKQHHRDPSPLDTHSHQ